MYSTFSGLELGKRALLAEQLTLHTTAHNIANANTTGYSRQRSHLVATTPFDLPEANRTIMPGQLGSGVKVDFVDRARNLFLDKQIRQETSTGAAVDTKVEYLNQVEALVNEPNTNTLNDTLNQFWSAWQELSVQPEDLAVRQSVVARGQQVAVQMQTLDSDLSDIQRQADQEVRTTVDQINELAQKIRDLNVEINKSIGVNAEPNDLMDQRDELSRQLSELGDFKTQKLGNGLYSVTLYGHTLVQDNVYVPMTVTQDPANNNYLQATWSDDGSAAVFSDGKMAGLQEVRDSLVPAYRSALDQMAQTIMNAVNPLQAAGYANNAAAPSGEAFFLGTGVKDWTINPILLADPNQVAAATAAGSPGDGSNALALAQLKDAKLMAAGTQTVGEYYQSLVAQIGLDSQTNQNQQTVQTQLMKNLTDQQQSISGVNLDEEATDMMKYQEAYNAAIRMTTVMDSALDTLINKMGIVGT